MIEQAGKIVRFEGHVAVDEFGRKFVPCDGDWRELLVEGPPIPAPVPPRSLAAAARNTAARIGARVKPLPAPSRRR